MDKRNIYKPNPDYIIYDPHEKFGHHEFLKVLSDPNDSQIPSNFEFLYKSNKTGVVVYKINKSE